MLTAVLAVLLGLLIGAVLGGLGGGGSVLTVPALVYALGLGAQEATTSSLLIVGVTALAGVASYAVSSQVRWATAASLGILGVPATYAGSRLNALVDAGVLLLAFSALMLVVAALLIADAGDADESVPTVASDTEAPLRWWHVALTALGIGLLTGFFGVGGGFAIVPALVLVLRLPMATAVGTSLLVISLNSAVALASRATTGSLDLDWSVVLPFTVAAVLATMLGRRVADRVPADRLQGGFALLLVAVAVYQGVESIVALG